MENVKAVMEPKWVHFGRSHEAQTSEKVMELMNSERYKLAAAGDAPMTYKTEQLSQKVHNKWWGEATPSK